MMLCHKFYFTLLYFTFVDFESVDGTVKGIFAKSESGKVMYPCSVCCKEVTDKSDTSGRGIECSGCGCSNSSKSGET